MLPTPIWLTPGVEKLRFTGLFVLVLLCPTAVSGQLLEPRALTNVPVGTDFVLAGYNYTEGDILLDPSAPVEIHNARLHTVLGAWVHSINFFGMSGKVDVVVPFADGHWTGAVSGIDSSTSRTGFGDPRVRLSVNFAGAPALRKAEFRNYHPHLIFGASLQMIAPLGQYDPSKLINLGSNRWTFRPQIGAAYWLGHWIVETYVAGWFFTENDDFVGGNKLQQYPMGAVKLHLIHTMPRRRMWMALDAGYAIGGRTRLNDRDMDTRMSTFRFGVDVVLPLHGGHTLKIAGEAGVRHERGPDFNGITAVWQYLWGG